MVLLLPKVVLSIFLLLLSACVYEEERKELKSVSLELQREMDQRSLSKSDPIIVRIFKENAEFEVWKRDSSGTYVLLKTYPICKWSGVLGPKRMEGDYQSPEGFYMVTPDKMNPQSKYYLSFDLGFPNRLDRFWGRSGRYLMVHGACKSVGCYAMTDAFMADIYALVRDSFMAGQDVIQVHIFPFRMTDENMERFKHHFEYDFWLNLKEGYEAFEKFQEPLQISVCNGRYFFNQDVGEMEKEIDHFYPCPVQEDEGEEYGDDAPLLPVSY